jgi:hypothetical protein
LFIADLAGHNDISPVHPHPQVLPRHKIRGAVMAEPPAELPVDPDPLAHRDLPREFHVTVAPFGMRGKRGLCQVEEHPDTFLCYLFCRGIFGFLFHGFGDSPVFRLCCTFCVMDK